MQTKHTFLFTFVLGLAWTGYLFAFALGPEPARNGIFGSSCNASTCHVGNGVNAPGGSVSLDGLPAGGWTPGQTYQLSVTVQRTGQRLFGFQLSAVSDSTNEQAGSFAAGSRIQVICGRGTAATSNQQVACTTAGAIQYVEHLNATVVTNTYFVVWTAPTNPSFGKIRFNVAGNAANGDGNITGDFIYTRVDMLDPGAPPVNLTTRAFTLVDRGGVSLITDGSGTLTVGYSRIQPNAGSTTPSGVAIFGLRQNNITVTEAGVPASPLLRSARIPAEVDGPVNTGVAIANPTSQTATINFQLTDSTGTDVGTGIITLGPGQQTAKFLHEAPFSVLAGRTSFQGVVTFTSDADVSVVALRTYLNERAIPEFLTTTLPVTNLAAAPASGTVTLPHFADGGGWTTQIVLVNPTTSIITGNVQFFGQGSLTAPATPVTITANAQLGTVFNYNIPPRTSFKLTTAGALPSTQVGSVRVTPSIGAAPSALVVFSYRLAGVTVSEAGVPGIRASTFRMYVEETATGGIGAIQTGFAIANLGSTAATVNLELTNLNGSSNGQVASVTVPGNGQVAKFLHEAFPSLTFPFKGIMRISGGGSSGLSVVGLRGRINERGDFLITTTPPTDEASPASSAELLFPHLANGDGWTTQFILFSGTAGQASSGNLNFFKQDGTPLSLNLN